MSDDDINQMLERLSDGGIPETQLQRFLVCLGEAERLNAELEAALMPSQRRIVREEAAGAMLKVFRRDS